MSARPGGLRATRRAGALLLASMVLSCTAAATCAQRWHRAADALEDLQRAMAGLEGRADTASRQRQRLELLQAELGALAAGGFLSAGGMPRWTELLAQAQDTLAVTALAAEAVGDPAPVVAYTSAQPGVQVGESRMRLRFQVLHEGELLGFLDALKALPAGIMRPRTCTLERLPAPEAGTPTLQAQCEIGWAGALVQEEAHR